MRKKMEVQIKIKALTLESERPENWKNSILAWETDFDDLASDPSYTHVSWTIDGQLKKVLNARRVLAAPRKRIYSRKYQRYFYIISKKDVSLEAF